MLEQTIHSPPSIHSTTLLTLKQILTLLPPISMLKPPPKRPHHTPRNLASPPHLLGLMKLNAPLQVHTSNGLDSNDATSVHDVLTAVVCLAFGYGSEHPDAAVQFGGLEADRVHGVEEFVPREFGARLLGFFCAGEESGEDFVGALGDEDLLDGFDWWSVGICVHATRVWCRGCAACFHLVFDRRSN